MKSDTDSTTETAEQIIARLRAANPTSELASLPEAFAPLKELRHWLVWRWEIPKGAKKPKPTKVPYQTNGWKAETNNPATWCSYAEAIGAVEHFDGIGIVVKDFGAFDFDKCRDPVTKVIDPWVSAKIAACGSYAEITPSGTGLRTIGLASAQPNIHSKLPVHGKVSCEIYRHAVRFITVTGRHLETTPNLLANIDAELDATLAELLEKKRQGKKKPGPGTGGDGQQTLPAELEAMLRDPSTPGQRSDLLWTFLHRALRIRVPDEIIIEACVDQQYGGGIFQHCQENGGRPCAERQLERAKADAVRRAEQVLQNIQIGEGISAEDVMPTVLTLDEMQERLVYIGMAAAVADRETGRIRKREVALSEYAASIYISGSKSIPVLKAWIASPRRVTVDALTWWPGQAQICRPPESVDGAQTALNLWRGINPMRSAPNDWEQRVVPFLDHVAYLVPEAADRDRFLDWLAHILQRPVVLPHTSYLMTTPTQGTGRNLLASVLVRVLHGHVAHGVALPELLDSTFNGRLSRKLLAVVDEAREGSGDMRYPRAQALKRLITAEHRYINPKYGVPVIEKNCCRWLMFSNHRDAIPIDNADRRIVFIENPIQRKDADYYTHLYGMLDDVDFIASVRRLLETRDVSFFNPGETAPMTEAKARAVAEMMTELERAVFDFRDECQSDLTTLHAIREYVASTARLPIKGLNHAIVAAGMTTVRERRIRTRSSGVRETVVIVRNWTLDMVKQATPEQLLEVIEPPF